MNVSFNLFRKYKNIKNNILTNCKKILISFPIIYGIKKYFFQKQNNKALCYVDNDDDQNVMDFNEMYSEFDEGDFGNMAMNDPNMSPEELNMLREEVEKAKITPPFSFARIPQLFMNQNDDKWNGLRFTFDWKPTKMYSLEYSASASSFKKLDNYRLSCLNVVPSNFFFLFKKGYL
jgi:hypothetical protein